MTGWDYGVGLWVGGHQGPAQMTIGRPWPELVVFTEDNIREVRSKMCAGSFRPPAHASLASLGGGVPPTPPHQIASCSDNFFQTNSFSLYMRPLAQESVQRRQTS